MSAYMLVETKVMVLSAHFSVKSNLIDQKHLKVVQKDFWEMN